MSEVLGFCKKNQIADFHVFTDFKSNKIRLLRDFPEIQDSAITCDRDLMLRIVPDNRSIMVFSDAGRPPVNMKLTQLDLQSLGLNQPITAEKRWEIPDSLLERGNFTPTIHGDRIVLLQNQLQEILYIQIKPEQAVTKRWSLATSRLEYEAVRTILEAGKRLNTLPYDSALVLNQRVRLPMQTTSAIQIDQDTLRLFRSFYFYFPENGDALGNRGFVFLQQMLIDENMSLTPQFAKLMEPFLLPDSVLVAPFVSYPHQALENGRYLAYYNLYNDRDNRFKLSNRYLGCIYTPGPAGLNIQENLRLGLVEASDSQQIAFRRLVYGNNPAYFAYQGKRYVLLKYSAQVLDVSRGSIYGFRDFIKQIVPDGGGQELLSVYAIRYHDNQLDWVFNKKTQPGLFYSRITTDGKIITTPLEYKGQIDEVSIQEGRILVLTKNEERNMVEVVSFPRPK